MPFCHSVTLMLFMMSGQCIFTTAQHIILLPVQRLCGIRKLAGQHHDGGRYFERHYACYSNDGGCASDSVYCYDVSATTGGIG